MDMVLFVLLVAVGLLWSYLAFRGVSWFSGLLGNTAASVLSAALTAWTIHAWIAGGAHWLASCLVVGVAAGVSHAVFLANFFSSTLALAARVLSGDEDIETRATFDRADAAVHRGELEEAERIYLEAAAAYPKDPAPHMRLADLRLKQDRPDAAAQALRDAAARAKNLEQESLAVFRLADVLAERLGRTDAARTELEAFIRRRPDTKYARLARERVERLSGHA